MQPIAYRVSAVTFSGRCDGPLVRYEQRLEEVREGAWVRGSVDQADEHWRDRAETVRRIGGAPAGPVCRTLVRASAASARSPSTS
jgi:hypothetical protein